MIVPLLGGGNPNLFNHCIMIKHRSLFTVIGFLLAGTGLLALIVSLVGLELSALAWMKALPPLAAFVAKIVMTLAGIVMIYVAQTDWEREV